MARTCVCVHITRGDTCWAHFRKAACSPRAAEPQWWKSKYLSSCAEGFGLCKLEGNLSRAIRLHCPDIWDGLFGRRNGRHLQSEANLGLPCAVHDVLLKAFLVWMDSRASGAGARWQLRVVASARVTALPWGPRPCTAAAGGPWVSSAKSRENPWPRGFSRRHPLPAGHPRRRPCSPEPGKRQETSVLHGQGVL